MKQGGFRIKYQPGGLAASVLWQVTTLHTPVSTVGVVLHAHVAGCAVGVNCGTLTSEALQEKGIAVRLCVLVGAQCVGGFVLVRGDCNSLNGYGAARPRSKPQSYHNLGALSDCMSSGK